jgi:heme-degrading monooxygenase HmoA
VVREFWVAEGCEEKFEQRFGELGSWAVLLTGAEGFIGTRLELLDPAERHYRAVDFWKSHLDFEAFRDSRQTECEAFRSMVVNEEIIVRELVVGSFYIDDEPGQGTELIPA